MYIVCRNILCCYFLQEVTSPLLAAIKEKDNVNRPGEVRSAIHKQIFFLESLKKWQNVFFQQKSSVFKTCRKKPKWYFLSLCFASWIFVSASIAEVNLPCCHAAPSHHLSPGFPVSLHWVWSLFLSQAMPFLTPVSVSAHTFLPYLALRLLQIPSRP